MYISKHFALHELVPSSIFEALGIRAWELLDERLLVTLDALREHFGPCTVNNWRDGGPYRESGFRTFESTTGVKFSQHRYGRAADCKFATVTPVEASAYIVANAEKFRLLTTLEDVAATPTWLHVDVRLNRTTGVRIVKP